MYKQHLTTAAIFASAIVLASTARAQLYYSSGHADIGISFEEGQLHPHWHGTTSGGSAWNLPSAEYAPGEVVAQISNKRNSASGSANYLGVPTGTSIYVAGLISYQPWLGFGAEELDRSDWNGDFTIRLTSWVVPAGGNFALYTTNGAGTSTPDIYLSTFNPAATNDPFELGMGPNVFGIGVGGHDHYQFGFTTPGYYEMTLQWSGDHVVEEDVTASGTFGFQVVPEPTTLGLIVPSVLGLLSTRRRGIKKGGNRTKRSTMLRVPSNVPKWLLAIGIFAFFGGAPLASAQYLYTVGHGDFRVSYDEVNNEFIPHVHLDGGATYLANQILMRTDAARVTVTNNAGSIERFLGMLGIAAGERIWVMGGSGVGPYLGFSGEGLVATDWNHTFTSPYTGEPFTGAVIQLELTGWSMPVGAQFGLYQTLGLPPTWGNRARGDVVFSTYDPAFTLNQNKLIVAVGGHEHYAFGFTKPGDYELDLTFSSVYQGNTVVSTPATFSFQVVPEPSTSAVVISGIIGLLSWARLRRRIA